CFFTKVDAAGNQILSLFPGGVGSAEERRPGIQLGFRTSPLQCVQVERLHEAFVGIEAIESPGAVCGIRTCLGVDGGGIVDMEVPDNLVIEQPVAVLRKASGKRVAKGANRGRFYVKNEGIRSKAALNGKCYRGAAGNRGS